MSMRDLDRLEAETQRLWSEWDRTHTNLLAVAAELAVLRLKREDIETKLVRQALKPANKLARRAGRRRT